MVLAERDRAKAAYSDIRADSGAAVALRFDDSYKTDFEHVLPSLLKYGLPAGLATVRVNLEAGDGGNTTYMTHAKVAEMQRAGAEIMLHGQGDINVGGLNGYEGLAPMVAFESFLANDLPNLRASGYNVDSLVQPGEWTGEWNFTTQAAVTKIEALLRANVSNFEAYVNPNSSGGLTYREPFPSQVPYGHIYIGTAAVTLANLETFVHEAIARGASAELTFHSYKWGQAGELTTANFESFCAFLDAQRKAGLLDILSPTGLTYAMPGTPTNLMRRGDFEAYSVGALSGQITGVSIWLAHGAAEIVEGGRTGPKCLKTTSTIYASQRFSGDMYRTVRVEGWVKDTEAGPHEAILALRTENPSSEIIQSSEITIKGVTNAGWTRVAACINIDRRASLLNVTTLAKTGTLLWDDLTLYKA